VEIYELSWIDRSFNMNTHIRKGSLKEMENLLQSIEGCSILYFRKVR